MIADAARTMPHTLRSLELTDEITAEPTVLVGFDQTLAAEATRTSNRIRGLLTQLAGTGRSRKNSTVPGRTRVVTHSTVLPSSAHNSLRLISAGIPISLRSKAASCASRVTGLRQTRIASIGTPLRWRYGMVTRSSRFSFSRSGATAKRTTCRSTDCGSSRTSSLRRTSSTTAVSAEIPGASGRHRRP